MAAPWGHFPLKSHCRGRMCQNWFLRASETQLPLLWLGIVPPSTAVMSTSSPPEQYLIQRAVQDWEPSLGHKWMEKTPKPGCASLRCFYGACQVDPPFWSAAGRSCVVFQSQALELSPCWLSQMSHRHTPSSEPFRIPKFHNASNFLLHRACGFCVLLFIALTLWGTLELLKIRRSAKVFLKICFS